jgi:hypothetical protein
LNHIDTNFKAVLGKGKGKYGGFEHVFAHENIVKHDSTLEILGKKIPQPVRRIVRG